MKNISNWIAERLAESALQKGAKIEMPASGIDGLFCSVEKEKGKEARQTLAKEFFNKLSGIANTYLKEKDDPEHTVKQYEKYVTDPKFKEEVKKRAPSEFHRTLIENEVNTSWGKIAGSLKSFSKAELSKAVQEKDMNRIKRAHNKDADLTVDHKPHLEQFPAPVEYDRMLKDPAKFKSVSKDSVTSGISAKMVHNATGYSDGDGWVSYAKHKTLMSKPYHKKIESKTRSWVKHPILGWASMATKALFNAGKIGHLAEDVSVHEHDGVPMTVHSFAPDYQDVATYATGLDLRKELGKRPVDSLQLHQIGVMDFLTNNLDRHGNNLMIADHTDERGYHPVLAIDHERNFQYNKNHWNASGSRSSPLHFLSHQALGRMTEANHFDGYHELKDWWHENGQPIKDEFLNQVQHIKDENIRKHVTDNFLDRHRAMTEWTKDGTGDAWEKKSIGRAESYLQKFQPPKASSKALSKMIERQDPIAALNTISDVINGRDSLRPSQFWAVKNAITKTVSGMNPEQVGDAIKHIVQNPKFATKKMKDFPVMDWVLDHASQPEGYDGNGFPVHKMSHLARAAEAIDSLPADKKEVLQYWSNKFKRKLDERGVA